MTNEKFEITWKVSDGYVGHGPHTLKVRLDDFESCESVEDVIDLLEEEIEDDLQKKVSWVSENYTEVAEKIYQKLRESVKEEVD